MTLKPVFFPQQLSLVEGPTSPVRDAKPYTHSAQVGRARPKLPALCVPSSSGSQNRALRKPFPSQPNTHIPTIK